MHSEMIHDGYAGRGSRTYQVYETDGIRWTAFVNGDHGVASIYMGDLREHFETGAGALPEKLIEFDFDEWETEPCADCDYDGERLIKHADDCYWKANPDALTPEKAQSVAEQAVLEAAGRK
jgi:hypothetical protein